MAMNTPETNAFVTNSGFISEAQDPFCNAETHRSAKLSLMACHSTSISLRVIALYDSWWCFMSFCSILNASCILIVLISRISFLYSVFLDSEVSMWLHWFHRGALTGDAIVSDMLFVSVERFREATERWLDFRMSPWGVRFFDAGHPANAHLERRAFVCPTLCFACLACRTSGCHASRIDWPNIFAVII